MPYAAQAVSILGDIDQDGFADVGEGVPLGNQFLIFRGGATFDANVDGTYTGVGETGACVAGGSDVNGDGIVDFVSGAPTDGPNGRAQVFFGVVRYV